MRRALIVDATGNIHELGEVEITPETTLNDLMGGREIAMLAMVVYSDTPGPPGDGRMFRPEDGDRFLDVTWPRWTRKG